LKEKTAPTRRWGVAVRKTAVVPHVVASFAKLNSRRPLDQRQSSIGVAQQRTMSVPKPLGGKRFASLASIMVCVCMMLATTASLGQSVAFQGLITTVAGTGIGGYSGDIGLATAAELSWPFGVAVDGAGNIYVADQNNNCIRKVAAATGIITTVAGTGTAGYTGDNGAANSAELSGPTSIVVDKSGNIYIADTNNERIRMINAGTGIISTVAGKGTAGYNGDNISAISAELYSPRGIALDGNGNLYIADSDNGRIRMVTAGGVITTVAGNGGFGYNGDARSATSATLASPYGVAVDGTGNVYIADFNNQRVRKVAGGTITTVAGTGTAGYNGDNIAATTANLYHPVNVMVDVVGNLYIADFNNQRVRKVAGGRITTVAGSGTAGYNGDNIAATSAALYYPIAMAIDGDGNLYISDEWNNRVRKVQTATVDFASVTVGQRSAVSSLGFSFSASTQVGSVAVLTDGASGKDFQPAAGGTCAAGTYTAGSSCTVNVTFGPLAPGLRKGAVVLYDNSNNPLITLYISGTGVGPAIGFGPGIISTVAGTGTAGYNGDNIAATSATLGYPNDAAVDGAGNLYIADWANNRIRKVTAATGMISTVAGNASWGYNGDNIAATSATLSSPVGVALDGSGNFYIADSSNNRIRKVTAATGVITTVAGTGAQGYNGDNIAATSAQLSSPYAVTVDGAGNVYIADASNGRIRKVTAATGIISTVAGSGAWGYNGENIPATSAQFASPLGVAVDGSGNFYIADSSNNRIRKVTAATGVITTVAGTGAQGYNGDNIAATSAQLNRPYRLQVDGSGNLYIADLYNYRIRKLTAATGMITTVAGTGNFGYNGDNIPATSAKFNNPISVALDPAGNLFIADYANQRIRKINVSDPPSLTFADTNVGSVSAAQDVTVENLGNAQLSISQISTAANFSLGGADTSCSTSGQLIDASGSCILGIQFAPQAAGANSGSVVLTDNALNASAATQTINLSGNGLQPETQLAFGTAPAATVPLGGNAGVVTVQVEDSLNAVVATSSASVMLTVTGPGGYTQIYNATASSGVATFDLTAVPLNLAGSYSYTATSTPLTQAVASETVNKGTPTVTWAGPYTLTYGQNLTSVLGASVASPAGTIAYTSGGNPVKASDVLAAGTYTLTATFTPNDTTNYDPATAIVSLTVNKASLTVTADGNTMTYGGTLPTLTASYSGFVNGDTAAVLTGTPSLTTAATSSSSAGNYAITAAQGTLTAANYTFTYVNGTLTVNKASLTVTADSKLMTYGGTLPTLTASYAGFVNGETAAVLTGIPSLTTTATSASNASTYPITATQGTLAAANYMFTFAAGTLTVNKATLTVTADIKSMTYGGTVPSLTASYNGFVNGDTAAVLTGAPALTTTATSSSNAGDYTITAAQGTLTTTNYTLTFANGTLTIGKAALSVAANNKTRTYGAVNPAFDGTMIGVVAGDGITASYASATDISSPAGTYPITPTLTDPNGRLGNYTTAIMSGTLTIGKAALTVVANNKQRTYGAPNPVLDGTLTGAIAADGITASYATDANAASIVGDYVITPTVNDPNSKLTNYTVTTSGGKLTIDPAPLTVVTNNKSRTYGIVNPAFDGSMTGLVNSDPVTVSFATSATQTSDAGSYAIMATLADPQSKLTNYAVSNPGGTLTITPASTTASITASKAVVNLPASVTLTATVASSVGTPTGSVTFYEGSTNLGTANLDNTGKASLTAQNPPAQGKSSVSAIYAGSTDYSGSSSSTMVEYVFPGAPDYKAVAGSNSVTIHRGQTATIPITVTPSNGYDGSVAFQCSGLAALMTCEFTPAQIAGDLDGAPVTGNLVITTTAGPIASIGSGESRSTGGRGLLLAFWTLGAGCVGGFFLAGVDGRRRISSRGRVYLLIACALLLVFLAGCGTHGPTVPTATPIGTVNVTVTATGTATTAGLQPATTTQQIPIQVTVTQ
jgi:sugar lactone lactonase YvrE